MLSLLAAWISLLTFLLALGMVVYRPLMTDLTVTAVLWFGAPGAMCLAGMMLWSLRREPRGDPDLAGARLQSWVAILLAVLAAAMVYALIIGSDKFESIEPTSCRPYHAIREAPPRST